VTDAQILTDFVLEPVFGIEDLKVAANVKFVAGSKGLRVLEEIADQEDGIAFAMAQWRWRSCSRSRMRVRVRVR
jgi:uncharacterized protein (DUF1015 family)